MHVEHATLPEFTFSLRVVANIICCFKDHHWVQLLLWGPWYEQVSLGVITTVSKI